MSAEETCQITVPFGCLFLKYFLVNSRVCAEPAFMTPLKIEWNWMNLLAVAADAGTALMKGSSPASPEQPLCGSGR